MKKKVFKERRYGQSNIVVEKQYIKGKEPTPVSTKRVQKNKKVKKNDTEFNSNNN